MATNQFKPFATGPAANVTPQEDWEALPALLSGFTSGKASSAQVNKALRQTSFIASALAEFVSEKSGEDVLDDGDVAGFIAKLTTSIATVSYVPDVGELYMTKSKTDPNAKWPGTTWVYLGDGLTLRTAKADFSDLGTTVGADSLTLSVANMPGHTHAFSATTGAYDFVAAATSTQAVQNLTSGAYDFANASTSSYDYGTKTAASSGAHTHSGTARNNDGNPVSGPPAFGDSTNVAATYQIASAGAHTHSVAIGAHSHTLDLPSHTHTVSVPAHSHTVDLPSHTHSVSGTTGSAGSASAFSTIQKSVMVAVWERTA